MVDHGTDQQPAIDIAKLLNERWKGAVTSVDYVAEYYDYKEVEKFEKETLGINEKTDGFHDDFYTAAISVAIAPESARMPERIKRERPRSTAWN